MSKSKPIWPYPDIVKMTAHVATNQWKKKHHGKVHYFGPLDRPKDALALWRQDWPRIIAGQPRQAPSTRNVLNMDQAVDAFLGAKLKQYDRGELEWVSYLEYQHVANRAAEVIGGKRHLNTIGPDDFTRMMGDMAKLSPSRRSNSVIKTKAIFGWLVEHGVLEKLPNFGPEFRTPPARVMRKAKREGGPRLLTPRQIHALIGAAEPWMRACILLGINGGMGPSDITGLSLNAWHGRWIDENRRKTESHRRFPLWLETFRALRAAPHGEKSLIDVPGYRKKDTTDDRIIRQFKRIKDELGLDIGFYDLRRTFATVAADTGDQHAAQIIMGQVINGVHEGYIQRFPDQRLLRVSNHVRRWLYADVSGGRARTRPPAASAAPQPRRSSTPSRS